LITSQLVGKSHGVDSGIAEDILEEATDALDLISELVNKAGDPGEFSISADDIMAFINTAGAFSGIPVKGPENLVKGWVDYVTGKTDDETALIGISPYMRGDYDRGRNFPLIHKHLPENGGDLGTLREELEEGMTTAEVERMWPRIEREYIMYNEIGGFDAHANFLYGTTLKTPEAKAQYIYDLYKQRVLDKRPLRRNVSITDMAKAGSMDDWEFMDMTARWMALGVIDASTFNKFISMTSGDYEDIYYYDKDDDIGED